MTPSGRSLFYFGIYGFCTGLLYVTIPKIIIERSFLPSLPDGWARSIGLMSLVVGCYDMTCGRGNVKPFIKASVYVRPAFAFGIALLVICVQMPLIFLLPAFVEVTGAFWTALALRSESAVKRS
ncbi:MAG TPA: hypothetical protein VHZ50_08210 [Puia sp.]|nr:hypothetical protein [Puia sp.]